MASAIDPLKPTSGAALTADSRSNFSAAESEITALQVLTAILDSSGNISTTGTLGVTGATTLAAVDITGNIASSAQVAVASFTIDVDTETFSGNNFGISSVDRVADGDWEFQLDATPSSFESLTFGIVANYGLNGAGVFQALKPVVNGPTAWFRLVFFGAAAPTVQTDPTIAGSFGPSFQVVVFDSGRT